MAKDEEEELVLVVFDRGWSKWQIGDPAGFVEETAKQLVKNNLAHYPKRGEVPGHTPKRRAPDTTEQTTAGTVDVEK